MGFLNIMTRWLETVGEISPLWFVVLSIILMSTMVPKTAISILCGTLYPPAIGCGLIIVIATAAALINYAIGRLYRPSINPDTSGGRVALVLRDAGFGLHLLVRLSPVPAMMISYLCGSLRCRFIPYALAALVAAMTQWLWVMAASSTVTAIGDGGALRWTFAILAILAALVASIAIAQAASKQI